MVLPHAINDTITPLFTKTRGQATTKVYSILTNRVIPGRLPMVLQEHIPVLPPA